MTIGGFDVVYPAPGFVIATPVICPFTTVATPTYVIFGVPVLEVAIPTLTVWSPDL